LPSCGHRRRRHAWTQAALALSPSKRASVRAAALHKPASVLAGPAPHPPARPPPRMSPRQVAAACQAWRSPAAGHETHAGSSASQDPAAAPPPLLPTAPAEALRRAPAPFWLLSSASPDFADDVRAHPLSDWAALASAAGRAAEDATGAAHPDGSSPARSAPYSGRHVLMVAADGGNAPATPAWPLRNALLMAATRWRARSLRVRGVAWAACT
jgi:hypothetical protein